MRMLKIGLDLRLRNTDLTLTFTIHVLVVQFSCISCLSTLCLFGVHFVVNLLAGEEEERLP